MKRYVIWCLRGLSTNVEQHQEGEWVKWKDVEQLKAENEQLKEENDNLLDENQKYKAECYNGCDVFEENERLAKENDTLSDKIRDLQGSLTRADSEIERLNRKIGRINDNRNHLRKRIGELKKGWYNDEKRGEEHEAVLKAENERLKKQLADTGWRHDEPPKDGEEILGCFMLGPDGFGPDVIFETACYIEDVEWPEGVWETSDCYHPDCRLLCWKPIDWDV